MNRTVSYCLTSAKALAGFGTDLPHSNCAARATLRQSATRTHLPEYWTADKTVPAAVLGRCAALRAALMLCGCSCLCLCLARKSPYYRLLSPQRLQTGCL